MKELYFIISNSDGDTTVEAVDKDTLLERIEEGYYGSDTGVLKELPKEGDTNHWGENILVIKGKVVSPVAEQVVTKYDIE